MLLIMTDQQRRDAVGYINPAIKTPNLDELAAHSINCTQAYVQSPQCQPSRASILTGRYPTAHKVWWNNIDLPKSERTIGNILRDNGYATAYFGKAHINIHDKAVIKQFGFDTHFLFSDWLELSNYMSWDTDRSETNAKDEYFKLMADPYWTGTFKKREVQHEDVITQRAIKFLKQKRQEPYFAVVSFAGPHPPYASPPPYCEMYDINDGISNGGKSHFQHTMRAENWKKLKEQYYGAVSWIDDNIGKILKHVDNDAIIIFTSDHGDILGDHGLFSKGIYAYEGNTRVPLLFRDIRIGNKTYDHLVQSIDIVPTLLQSLGLSAPRRMQGVSLRRGFISGDKINQYAISMIGYHDRLRMIRVGDYKYWRSSNEECLFDLKNDPGEQNNIADPALLSKMRLVLLDALIKAEDNIPYPKEER